MSKINQMLENLDNKVWDIPSVYERDRSIVKRDLISVYEDNYGISDLKDANSYSFSTNNEDIWIVPGESFLIVNAKLRKTNGNEFLWANVPEIQANPNAVPPIQGQAARNAENVTLDFNGFNLFTEARLFVNNEEVESIEHLGISTLLHHLRNYNDFADYYNSQYNEMIRGRNDTLTTIREQGGNFELMLPVNKIFPMLSQITHAFRGAKFRITLTKSEDAKCVTKVGAATPNGKVMINKIVWKIPQVEPSLPMQARLEQMLSRSSQYTVTWPAMNVYKLMPPKTGEIRVPLASTIHKPTSVFVAFQNLNRSTSQEHKFMMFDQMTVEKINCEVNSVKFPEKDIELDFRATNKKVLEAYDRFLDSCKNKKSIWMTYHNFETEFPIYHIDVSKHKPELYENSNFPNIVLNVKFRNVPTVDYVMWVMVENEREATLNMDNKQMKIIR